MIPNKSVFKFEELTPITGVKPYVLRYWETEFPEIAPLTSDSGQKIYSRKDLEVIFKIKKLLFDDKMNIPAVKAHVANEKITNVETMTESFMEPQLASIMTPQMVEVLNLIEHSLQFISEIKAKRNW
jgi:DNA-binding transcriptional MerR regulator